MQVFTICIFFTEKLREQFSGIAPVHRLGLADRRAFARARRLFMLDGACHGLAAYALGDPTAKREHRLSLNPLHHIDWFGLAAMLLVGFGWAKPVPVDMRYFKKPKQGMAITALAGPVSNLLLAMLLLLGARITIAHYVDTAFCSGLLNFLAMTAYMSVGLGLFNLIPISPLDGSKVLFAFLPDRAYMTLMRYEKYGMLVLFMLVWLGVGDNILSEGIYRMYELLVNWIVY